MVQIFGFVSAIVRMASKNLVQSLVRVLVVATLKCSQIAILRLRALIPPGNIFSVFLSLKAPTRHQEKRYNKVINVIKIIKIDIKILLYFFYKNNFKSIRKFSKKIGQHGKKKSDVSEFRIFSVFGSVFKKFCSLLLEKKLPNFFCSVFVGNRVNQNYTASQTKAAKVSRRSRSQPKTSQWNILKLFVSAKNPTLWDFDILQSKETI